LLGCWTASRYRSGQLFERYHIFFLKRKGVVDSADITIREQQINPLLMSVVSYFVEFLD
jgi:hypothetical protein